MVSAFLTATAALESAIANYNGSHKDSPYGFAVTRWWAEKMADTLHLPCIIIDINGPEDGELLESGRELPAGDFCYLECAVAHDVDPKKTVQNMLDLVQFAEDALAGIPNGFNFMQKETSDVPFGKRTSFSFMCTLYLGPQ